MFVQLNINIIKMKSFIKKNIYLFIVIFCSLFFFSYCNAEDISPRLAISPHTFELDVFPGETIEKEIEIVNKSEVALPIAIKLVDFAAKDEMGGTSFDASMQDTSISSRTWFEIENPNFILDAGEAKEVVFTVSVPDNAEPGGHYSVMLFEPQLPSFYFEEDQPKVIPVIGSLFLFSVKVFNLDPEVEQKLEVVEFTVPKEERLIALENFTSAFMGNVVQAANQVTITKQSPSNFILRIKNNDIYHIKPFGNVLIFNIFGKKIGEAKISQTTILPGKIRKFPIEFSPETPKYLKWLPESVSDFLAKNFFFGRYQAKLDIESRSPLNAGIVQSNISDSLIFYSFPWQFWIIFSLILLLFIFIIVKYKKRIILSLKVLLKIKK